MKTLWKLTLIAAFGLTACGEETHEEDYQTEALLAAKTYVTSELGKLEAAATALQAAAPAPDADGWNATTDKAAIDVMKVEWKKARVSYERVEGAIAVLFPDLDAATDERYDGFLEAGPDANLFDATGVTGVHAIERILWADAHPAEVVKFESALTGYVAAAFPATETEARDFKEKLTAQLVTDVKKMKSDFEPLALDTATAYRGVIGSMEEQSEKVALGSTGESESRYANHTLGDMRANLDGGKAIYATFEHWIESKDGGEALNTKIEEAFGRVEAAYSALSGDGLPTVPETWNPDAPTAADLDTPYGKLWSLIHKEADPDESESLVKHMAAGATALGIPTLPE